MRWTTPAHTVLAAGVAAAASLAAVVAAAPAATAAGASADATTAYTCTRAGSTPVQVAFGFEAEAPEPPATLTLFASPQFMNMQMESTVPGEVAKAAADDGATSVDVRVRTAFSDAYPSGQATWRMSTLSTQQAVPLGDQTVATAVSITGRGTHQLLQPGVNDLRAGDLAVTLTFRDSAGSVVGSPADLACATPAAPVSDTVWVSSVTHLDLLVGTDDWDLAWDVRTFGVGQPIPVRARVGANGTNVPTGWVDFTTSDGARQRVAVSADGSAVAELAGFASRSGAHQVGAVFVPADPVFYGGGPHAHPPGGTNYENPVYVGVGFVTTEPRVRVKGKDADRRTKVRVRVAPEFDSTATGKVKVNLRRLGAKKRWSATRTLGSNARAVAGFGKLPRGRYKVVVKYRGDDNHLGSRTVRTFRVRR